MTKHEEIKAELKTALKNKEATKLLVIRALLTAFTNESVAKGSTPQDMLSDDEVLMVIKRQAKQRKDSIEQYQNAGRQELADVEKAELEILETYLPTMLSQEELEPIVKAKIDELNIGDKTKIGMLIGAVMKETKGQADGEDVKAVAERLLS